MGDLLCTAETWFTKGNVGIGLAVLGTIVIGVMSLHGKISQGATLASLAGIATIFSAPYIVQFTTTCGTGTSPVYTMAHSLAAPVAQPNFRLNGTTGPTVAWPSPFGTVPNSPTITWAPVQGAVGYQFELDDYTTRTNYVQYQSNLNSTSYNTGNLTATHTYRYWVRAVDAYGNYSSWSASLFTVASPLSAPVVITPANATTVSQPLLIAWQPISDVTGYYAQVDQYGGPSYICTGNTGVSQTNFTCGMLAVGPMYRACVRGLDTNGNPGPFGCSNFFVR